MGKKRRRSKRSSKGIHSSVSASTIHACKSDTATRMLNKLAAWKKGQNPWITVLNVGGLPDQKYVRVKAQSAWGDPRRKYNIYTSNNNKKGEGE